MSSKNSIKKRKITKDCWSLHYAFLGWLRERLPVYLKDADKIVDLEFHKFEICGKEMTQKECIKRMIFLLNQLEKNDLSLSEELNYTDELLMIWKETFYSMWW